jgi:hypothetical protein
MWRGHFWRSNITSFERLSLQTVALSQNNFLRQRHFYLFKPKTKLPTFHRSVFFPKMTHSPYFLQILDDIISVAFLQLPGDDENE